MAIWIALQVLNKALDESARKKTATSLSSVIAPMERDVAHYIGGAVIAKSKHKIKNDGVLNLLNTLSSNEAPEEGTLLNAKSRGRLTNLTSDSKAMFVKMKQVFRDIFSPTTAKIKAGDYKVACYNNKVIQDCYFSSVSESDRRDIVFQTLVSCILKSASITSARCY